MFRERNSVLLQHASELAGKVPTPFYLFDIGNIRSRFVDFVSAWRAFFPDAQCAYSYKTNALPAITRLVRAEGARAEVVSAQEFRWALADGFMGDQIHFNGPGKSNDGLCEAIRVGAVIHVDSLDELDRALAFNAGGRPRVMLRISHALDSGARSRFGLLLDECWLAIDRLENNGLAPEGLHFHVGSNVSTTSRHVRSLSENAQLLRHLIAKCRAGHKVSLDVGGGFPSESATNAGTVVSPRMFAEAISETLRAHDIDPARLTLITEPGRCLVEDDGSLITSVLARKMREGQRLIVVDAGLDLVRSAGVLHHRIWFDGGRAQRHQTSYAVYGARCYESDLLPTLALGPEDVKVGSLVLISSAGAYALAQAGVWNGLCAQIYGIDGPNIFELKRGGRLSELTVSQVSECHQYPPH